MKKFNNTKRTYVAPAFLPTEVAFEQSLLVATARFLLEVDPDQNMNIKGDTDTIAPDEAGGEMYFEF